MIMRITKKRANVIYKVLLRHFDVDYFAFIYLAVHKKIFICAYKKDNGLCSLAISHNQPIEFTWATKYIFKKCHTFPNIPSSVPITLESFLSLLIDSSYDFKSNRMDLLTIKHELVKQIMSILNKHWCIIMRSFNHEKMVDTIRNLEALYIDEELNLES